MKRLYYLCLLGLMILPGYVFAQAKQDDTKQLTPKEENDKQGDHRTDKLKRLSVRKKKKIADQLTAEGSYYNAIVYYKEILEKKKDNVHALCQLAKLTYFLRDYKASEKYYTQLLNVDTAKYQKAKYFVALMQKYNAKCDEANKNFKSFISGFKNDDKTENMKDLKALVDLQMKGCDLQIKTLAKPEKVLIDLLDKQVNNPFTDFAPKPFGKDQIVFSSLRSDTAILLGKSDTATPKSHEFIATKTGTTWSDTKLFPAVPNSNEYYSGNGSPSPDGKKFYFTNCLLNKQLGVECEIYVAENSNGTWGTPKKLGANINDGSNNTHPDVKLVDGKEMLFFTSNRKGGLGGEDIWMAESDGKGDFKAAKNLGDSINTKYNDRTPFFDTKNNVLYFSSDGRVSIGGFDVFKSTYVNGKFTSPENMLAPINSSVDDYYGAVTDNSKEGYLVSNRPGGYSLKSETCCDDIYHFKIVTDIILKGYVATKKDPKTPVEGADVSFFIKKDGANTPIANLTTHKDEVFFVTLDPEKEYQVNATKSGFWGSETAITKEQLSKVKDTLEVVFYIDEIQRKKIQLKRIYYDFDKYNITKDYKKTLDSLADVLKEHPTWTAEIYGHCDSMGTEEYNMILSKKRAQAAADYLSGVGIDINRLSLIAKGKMEPIAPNSTPAGKDNPNGRAKNRRVDYKLNPNDKNELLEIEYTDNGPYKITKGKK